jgi:hypothetical protein
MKTLTYEDGSLIKVGDNVLLERGRTPGTVELIVITSEEMAENGVDEPGIMLLSPPFGRVFFPACTLKDDPIKFVDHGS